MRVRRWKGWGSFMRGLAQLRHTMCVPRAYRVARQRNPGARAHAPPLIVGGMHTPAVRGRLTCMRACRRALHICSAYPCDTACRSVVGAAATVVKVLCAGGGTSWRRCGVAARAVWQPPCRVLVCVCVCARAHVVGVGGGCAGLSHACVCARTPHEGHARALGARSTHYRARCLLGSLGTATRHPHERAPGHPHMRVPSFVV